MSIYRSKFERFNFLFTPPAEQKVDVFFEYEGDEDDLEALMEACWSALHEQYSCLKPFPIEGCSGWSSWLGGRKIDKVELDREPDLGVPGEGKPRIAETFDVDGSGYRVDSFYKRWVRPPCKDEGEELTTQVLDEIVQEEYEQMNDVQKALKDLEFKVVACSREEAEFVGGAGVAWVYRRIEDVEIDGIVNWDAATVAKERERWVKRYQSRDPYPTTFHRYWD